MTSVLFVDDEPNVLSGLRRMIRAAHCPWELHFAESAAAALEVVEANDVDVVVTDMRMPGMDGAALLAQLRVRHPGIVRIILSGHTEVSAALRSVPVAHQYLSKPCDARRLVAVVQRACDLQQRLANPNLRALVGSVDSLVSPSHTVLALNEMLARPDASVADVVGVLGDDPGMVSKLLQLVNSAFFGLPRQLSDVHEAVAYLGLATVRTLSLATDVFRAAGDGAVADLQAHAAHTASIASDLAGPDATVGPSRMDAFVAGLLHDVGRLLLATRMPAETKAIDAAVAAGADRDAADTSWLGVTHAALGAHLLNMWGLPYPIVEAVLRHHDAPEMAHREPDLPHIIYIADTIAHRHHDQLNPMYLAELGVADRVQELLAPEPSSAQVHR
jgi:HD-like signal output (HDOD) protein/CheY-like chemotaxis protein